MIAEGKRNERRGNKRFHASMGAFAVLGPHANKVGRVVDISLGGLAFRHVDRKAPLSGLNQLDVFMVDGDFHVNNIPFQTVSDYEVVKGGPLTSLTTRQSGLRFGRLTPTQRTLLEYFIKNHTLGES
jgi:hypothetical protein